MEGANTDRRGGQEWRGKEREREENGGGGGQMNMNKNTAGDWLWMKE